MTKQVKSLLIKISKNP